MPSDILTKIPFYHIIKKSSKLPLDVQIVFLSRLGTLLEKGYTLVDGLELMKLDPKHGQIAHHIHFELIHGRSLEAIFKSLGFSSMVISFLYLSRSTGNLDFLLERCSHILKQKKHYQDQFRKVMRYPLLLMFLLFLIIMFLHRHLLPSLQHFYHSLKETEIDGTMKTIYLFTDWTIKCLYILFFLMVLLFLFWIWGRNRLSVENQILIFSKIPFVNKLKRVEITYLFSFHLSLLLQNGSTIKSALSIMKEQNHMPILSRYAEELQQILYEGKNIHAEIVNFQLFERELSYIFKRSLDRGNLEKDLYHYAHLLMGTMENSMMKYISLIQPSLFIFFGSLIVAIYFSIFYPLFHLIQSI
ncbi:competence-related pilin export protein ComGB [Melghiribacillus thermohalophilus]|uniref:Competence-related pilin export protein ComGB n=1 Tax=Melghiribacillus thermohalophilus TaxID=1324956 RepID=A0A4R3ND84_9BACI|nr:competence type IV pilus assembly protein ComGB [Melghiribacillus thermohalophilus]TCT26953.1 competence-related pilin export protein ComGB [Melghiribacillus thermohalophilus]